MELAMRMQANGMKIASAHDAVVYTSSPRTIPALYKQRVRWTSGFLSNITREYRFMLLKPSYGHMGGFILPAMLISAFSIIFIISMFAYDIARAIQAIVIRFESIGLRGFSWSWPNFNWYYLHTSPIAFGGVIAIATVILFIFIGSKLSHGNTPRIRDIVSYMFLYSLIAPVWVGRSIINVAFGKQAAWR
jgi:cellulose synthase/poly-beta-1,6-N-acetylglucosamine synthase-like glycosyltransferase